MELTVYNNLWWEAGKALKKWLKTGKEKVWPRYRKITFLSHGKLENMQMTQKVTETGKQEKKQGKAGNGPSIVLSIP